MTILVTGPSNAGKSTLIHSGLLGEDSKHVWYASKLPGGEVPPEGVLHYNLLHAALSLAPSSQPIEWNLMDEPLLAKIIHSQNITKAIVLIAPIQELIARASNRTAIEPTEERQGVYNGDLWTKIIQYVDLFSIYQQLFDLLEERNIPYEILYSSQTFKSTSPVFLPSDRVYVHQNLKGSYFSVPTAQQAKALATQPGMEYQQVLLPHGIKTSAKGYEHVGSGRNNTFLQMRDRSFVGRSVLDIGCALGDILFHAERYGAGKLVGIEMKESRWNAATQIGHMLYSKAEFILGNFMDISFKSSFDDVLLLNVIHHVPDFRPFLEKSVKLTKERLIIEFPTLKDPKFQSMSPVPGDLDHLPLIGVSSKRPHVDQAFVYTRAGLERILTDFGRFRFQYLPSPIRAREILVCHCL